MQRLALFIGALIIMIAAAGSYLGANLMAQYIERGTAQKVAVALNGEGLDWVSVRTDGLFVLVSGPAPDEASRFRSLNIVKSVVNDKRVVDGINVVDPDDLRPPQFSLELLRNGDGISIIGLIPDATGRAFVLDSIKSIDHKASVTDMLETADFAEPEGWTAAVDYGLSALRALPRSKISIMPKGVTITAITDSQDEKQRIEQQLTADTPPEITVTMQINAPRPVITPFSLRLIRDEAGTRFDSCSADTETTVVRILDAARMAGLPDGGTCDIGLGAPTPRWGEAAETAIRAVAELGGGSLTFSDADITIVAPATTNQRDFDRIIFNLEQSLPDVFSVHAVLPPRPVMDGSDEVEAPEFLATKSPEGLVQLTGRLRDVRAQISVHNFAQAQFGGDKVHDTTRIDPSLPDGWPLRVLAGLEALGKLRNGSLLVELDMLEVRGDADRPEVRTEITQLLGERLGDASHFRIAITYREALNQAAQLPTPDECVAAINDILAQKQIVFAPSSTRIEGDGLDVIEHIAEAMTDCSEVPMEIGGHTDSQGRESMNQTLSQARAEAVLDGLLSLEVLTTFLTAKGYGESTPIADNDTEEGRRANRRIEFRLISSDIAPPAASAETVGEPEQSENDDGQN